MTNSTTCAASGCESPVSKDGYTLCYKHWLVENKAKTKVVVSEEKVKVSVTIKLKPNNLLTATQLGERLGLDGRKVNQVMSELGWIARGKKGWLPTAQGIKLCAEAREHHQSGVPFVLWPEAIVTSRVLANAITEFTGAKIVAEIEKLKLAEQKTETKPDKQLSFRDKFPPTHRATDGHWVRSRAETLIDNWLYFSGVMHAYERLLPVEEELYCDFYIPEGKVYIEYWGLENDPKYLARKKVKKDIYEKYELNLIELTDEHIKNLDDCLPKMLLKFNVVVD